MQGTSWIRRQDMEDPLLNRLLQERGLDDVPFFARRLPAREKHMRHWMDLASERDGDVAPNAVSNRSAAETAGDIKALARELGADMVGMVRLRPEFLEIDTETDHDWVIAIAVHEHYDTVLGGPDAVDVEAFRVYAQCAEIATALARHIREKLGHPARAHHNGGTEIQAIPTLHEAGFGELGKHGSLINPEFGASFRPAFVTTTLPLEADTPIQFGVQDYCVNCRLCTQACPADAIPPSDAFIETGGIKRWLVDIEKCYTACRLLPEYCHLCVDVYPYIHKENGNPETKNIFKAFLAERKKVGRGTAKSGAAASVGANTRDRIKGFR
jgi:epoxyqueuosine reductase